jgi:hypothetical protein
MRASRKHSGRVGSRLLLVCAAASLVPVLVLYRGYRQDGLDRAVGQGRAQTAVIEETAIAPVLGRRDLRAGLRRNARDGLLRTTELAIFSGRSSACTSAGSTAARAGAGGEPTADCLTRQPQSPMGASDEHRRFTSSRFET